MTAPLVRCPSDGWVASDDYLYNLIRTTERGILAANLNLTVRQLLVRCPECGTPLPERVNVEAVKYRVHHAHDDLGDGGVCTQCGQLHTATILPSCERCGGPDNSAVAGHHHCPATLLVEISGGTA